MSTDEGRRRVAQIVVGRRRAAKLSQAGLAARLTRAGYPTDRRQIGRWEMDAKEARDPRRPTRSAEVAAHMLLAIVEVTGVADIAPADQVQAEIAALEDQLRVLRLQAEAGRR